MFKPSYQLSPQILSNLTKIERFHGQLEGLQIPKELELSLERDNLVQSSYISNSIEGNPLTLPEVTNLLLSDRIPVNKDEKEVQNYFNLLKAMEEYLEQEISLDLVTELHLKLLTGVKNFAGQFRSQKVVVGHQALGQKGNFDFVIKHEPPFHQTDQIKTAIEELILWEKEELALPAPLKAGIFHHQFVYIHPFEDGNGRVCRLLTTLIFMKNQYPINKYFVLDDYYDIDRSLYSDKLHTADSGDKTEWLEYFSEGVMYSLQSVLAKVKKNYDTLKMENRPSSKEQEVIEVLKKQKELTAPKLAEKLQVSRQQAHNLLSNLLKKGLVAKKGKTKSSYYFLK
ncbi:MAG: Fic family protein [Patescibacteria group bacterium]